MTIRTMMTRFQKPMKTLKYLHVIGENIVVRHWCGIMIRCSGVFHNNVCTGCYHKADICMDI